MAPKEKTIEEVKLEILEDVTKIAGKIDNIDSRSEKASITGEALNAIIADVNLSKIEKAGILAYLTKKRLG